MTEGRIGSERDSADAGSGADRDALADERGSLADERDSLADERESLADDRESFLDFREELADARDALRSDRKDQEQEILAEASKRDDLADARDTAADDREQVVSRLSFLRDHEYDAGLQARRSAAMDRTDSHADRDAAAVDRVKLTEDDPPATVVEQL